MTRASFSFGENWCDFVAQVNQESLLAAHFDIESWLGGGGLAGKRVLDVGSGSGIHSFCFLRGGASRVISFDLDPLSVAATRSLWNKMGRPSHWEIDQGSVLDSTFMASLGQFDVVYAWGVLHHTGRLWEALQRTCSVVAQGGTLWISIYAKGPNYARDLALKRRYNRAGRWARKFLEFQWILSLMWKRLQSSQNPFRWNVPTGRGMNTYHDLVDWLGGLPYEVASTAEVLRFCEDQGLRLSRLQESDEGGCSVYRFERPGGDADR